MIPNIHQSIDEIIKAASPAQRIIWQHARLITGENAAVRQMVYIGGVTGSTLHNNVAGVLYIAAEMDFGSIPGGGTSDAFVQFYDEAAVNSLRIGNNSISYDSVGAVDNFSQNYVRLKNLYFRYLAATAYTHMKFIGYKITY